MAKPQEVTLTKQQQKKILSIFNGRSKKIKESKDSRFIANTLEYPRYQVMAFLEKEGLKEYSLGSYR